MYDRRAIACRKVLNLMRDKLTTRVFDTIIHMDTKFREACVRGKTIFEIARRPGERRNTCNWRGKSSESRNIEE